MMIEIYNFLSIKVKYLGKSECKATWEPSDCIPSGIIETYQKRRETVVMLVDKNNSGQISSTLKLSKNVHWSEPPDKKTKSSKDEIPDEG